MLDVRLTLTGTRPLVMHNVRLADPLDDWAKRLKAVSGKRGKTEENYEEMARLEYLGGLYHHKDTGPYVPGEWVFAALVRGARLSKQGQKVERGVILGDNGDQNPLMYSGPRTPEKLVDDANFRLVKAVRVGQARVMRTRPCFRQWATEVPLFVDLDVINFDELADIADRTGRFVGIGDHRPMYGRFEVKSEVL